MSIILSNSKTKPKNINMSFFPDIAPLTKEVNQLNQKLNEMINLLKENNSLLTQIKEKIKEKCLIVF